MSQSVMVTLDRLPYPDKIKKIIREEFDHVLSLMEFEEKGHDIFRRWYVDGKIYFHKVIDNKNPKKGVIALRYIDAKSKKSEKLRKKKMCLLA